MHQMPFGTHSPNILDLGILAFIRIHPKHPRHTPALNLLRQVHRIVEFGIHSESRLGVMPHVHCLPPPPIGEVLSAQLPARRQVTNEIDVPQTLVPVLAQISIGGSEFFGNA